MFTIKVRGKVHLFNNKKEDDFLQFLPSYFKCQSQDMEIKYYERSEFDQVDILNLDRSDEEKAAGTFYDFSLDDEVIKVFKNEKVLPPKTPIAFDENGNAVAWDENPEANKPIDVKTEMSTLQNKSLTQWPYVDGVFTNNLILE